jgi:NRPS condensation-like uncharacterized protein
MQIDAVSSAYPVTAGDINIYHARLIADQQITYVLEFSSTLELDRLNRAFAVLVRALPILSSVVQVEGTHFRRKPILDYDPAVTMAGEIESPAQAIERFTGMPCDPEREPPLKLLLIRAQGQDSLCFKADHVLTDAAGLKHLLYGFAEAYATGKISSPFNPDRGVGQVFRRFSPIALLRAATKAGLPRPGPTPIAGPFDAEPTFIEHVRLKPGEFERLHAAAKQSGATLNDILLTAVYRAVWQRLEQSQGILYPVMVPVDMRRYLPENKQGLVANLSSAIYPRLAAISQESFSGTLARVTACMDAFKRASPGLAAMMLMRVGARQGGRMMLERYRLAATRGSRFINLTNFGVIDGARCDFRVPLAQAYGVGPIQYAPGILIALSTYRNTLHLIVQGNDTRRFQPFINAFLKSILEELEQAG